MEWKRKDLKYNITKMNTGCPSRYLHNIENDGIIEKASRSLYLCRPGQEHMLLLAAAQYQLKSLLCM
jgi:hypothetical protein